MKSADAAAIRKTLGCVKRCSAMGRVTHRFDCPAAGRWLDEAPRGSTRSRLIDNDVREAVAPLIAALRKDGGERILVFGSAWFDVEDRSIPEMPMTGKVRESWTGNMIANAIEALLDGPP